jgi:hypothetical protein
MIEEFCSTMFKTAFLLEAFPNSPEDALNLFRMKVATTGGNPDHIKEEQCKDKGRDMSQLYADTAGNKSQ